MIALNDAPPVVKPRRRPGAKATGPKSEAKIKVAFSISAESARRIGVMAAMEGLERGQIIDEMIKLHCRKYVVQVRSSRSEDLANPTPEVSTTQPSNLD